ncbi:MAG: hypothetical protein ACKPKO_24830, partial [Candidatus Fonsibacter sp.]
MEQEEVRADSPTTSMVGLNIPRARRPFTARGANRAFCKALKACVERAGLRESSYKSALYTLAKEDGALHVAVTHVDNVMWAGDAKMTAA